MGRVVRLVTRVEMPDVPRDPGELEVSALLEAELADGRRVAVLDDRGWNSWIHGSDDIWVHLAIDEIEQTARVVVGPDEPVDGMTYEQAEDAYWRYLAGILERQGVPVEADEVRKLPHDVVLGPRLSARLAAAKGA